MTKHSPITTESLDVPGVEVVPSKQLPKGSKAITRAFYCDQVETIRGIARDLMPRENYLICRDGIRYTVYQKPRSEE